MSDPQVSNAHSAKGVDTCGEPDTKAHRFPGLWSRDRLRSFKQERRREKGSLLIRGLKVLRHMGVSPPFAHGGEGQWAELQLEPEERSWSWGLLIHQGREGRV